MTSALISNFFKVFRDMLGFFFLRGAQISSKRTLGPLNSWQTNLSTVESMAYGGRSPISLVHEAKMLFQVVLAKERSLIKQA